MEERIKIEDRREGEGVSSPVIESEPQNPTPRKRRTRKTNDTQLEYYEKKYGKVATPQKKTISGAPTKEEAATETDIKKALLKWRGLKTLTARELGMTPAGLTYHLKKNAELRQFQKECQDYVDDTVHLKIMQRAMSGDQWSAEKFWAMTKMKDRGFSYEKDKRQSDTPITVVINPVQPRDISNEVEIEDVEVKEIDD